MCTTSSCFGDSMIDEINAKMVRFAPELDSEYALYPLQRTRWLTVSEKTAKGEPCFVQSGTNKGVKKDYVFGPGPKGFGYYHLLTRASYLSLYARLTHEAPPGFCCFMSKAAQREYADYDDVKKLVFYRSRSSKPVDGKPNRIGAVTDDTVVPADASDE